MSAVTSDRLDASLDGTTRAIPRSMILVMLKSSSTSRWSPFVVDVLQLEYLIGLVKGVRCLHQLRGVVF